MQSEKIYFPNLNGLRFIAALLVIVHHIEQFKSIYGFQNIWNEKSIFTSFIHIIGHQGVVLFFVLSGFLITYLLLAEERKTSSINIKKFYFRRILRIWPLYFLVIIFSLFVFTEINFFIWPGYSKESIQSNLILKLILYIFFFANLVLVFFGVIPYASQTWSIGTEEQFYLIWPIVIKKIKNNRLYLMFSIILIYNILKLFLNSRYSGLYVPNEVRLILKGFINGFTIDCMAIGGFFAVLLFYNKRFLSVFLNTYVFYISIIVCIFLLLNAIYIPYVNSLIYSGLYGIIILNFGSNKSQKINMENSVFNYLGNISYGLYMLHPIGIIVSIKILIYTNFCCNWVIYPLSIIFTVFFATISYKGFESYFLKLKSKFAIIKSGNEK